MRTALLVALGVLGVGRPQIVVADSEVPALPWLHNLTEVVATESTQGTQAWYEDEPACAAEAYEPLQLTADLAPAAGRETIEASLTGGMTVRSSEGMVIAAMPGYPCEGSADELEVLAAGKVFREPTIVLAVTQGGRREQVTWVGLYRVGFEGRIDAMFTGVVEERVDGIVRRGSITLIPGGVLVHHPGGGVSLWVYDPVIHVYMPRGPFDREAEPHS